MILHDETGIDAKKAITWMAKRNIGCRPFFFPMHKQPVLIKEGLVNPKVKLSVSERMYKQGFYIPSGLSLSNDQIDRVAYALRELLCKRVQ